MKHFNTYDFVMVLTSMAMWGYLLIHLFKRRQRSKNHSPLPLSQTIEDPALLRRAEQEANTLNLREELSKNYEYVDSYSTMQGYSEDYMNQLVNLLEQNQINASFIFVDAAPAGVATFIGRNVGTFELYVQKDKSTEAFDIIERFRNH